MRNVHNKFQLVWVTAVAFYFDGETKSFISLSLWEHWRKTKQESEKMLRWFDKWIENVAKKKNRISKSSATVSERCQKRIRVLHVEIDHPFGWVKCISFHVLEFRLKIWNFAPWILQGKFCFLGDFPIIEIAMKLWHEPYDEIGFVSH